jgi:hypothetical protein
MGQESGGGTDKLVNFSRILLLLNTVVMLDRESTSPPVNNARTFTGRGARHRRWHFISLTEQPPA